MANQNPFARSEDIVLDDLRTMRTKARKSTVPVSEPTKSRRSSPIMALYKQLGINLQDLQA